MLTLTPVSKEFRTWSRLSNEFPERTNEDNRRWLSTYAEVDQDCEHFSWGQIEAGIDRKTGAATIVISYKPGSAF